MSEFANKKAPDFTLPNAQGKKVSLKDYFGKYVVLYFYPKDQTPGCTIEANTFNSKLSEFKKLNAVILGVSVDSCESHKKFIAAEKLNFVLLSDEKKEVVHKYKVWRKKQMMGNEYMGIARETFLIDRKGKIAKHYEKVVPAEHANEVLKDINELILKEK